MNDSVIGIAVEIYKNPDLQEVMECAQGLNHQDIQNVITCLENIKKSRAMNQTAKQLIEESTDPEYIEKLTEVLQTFNQSTQILREQLDYLIEILE